MGKQHAQASSRQHITMYHFVGEKNSQKMWADNFENLKKRRR